jgi:hypothetical protein
MFMQMPAVSWQMKHITSQLFLTTTVAELIVPQLPTNDL